MHTHSRPRRPSSVSHALVPPNLSRLARMLIIVLIAGPTFLPGAAHADTGTPETDLVATNPAEGQAVAAGGRILLPLIVRGTAAPVTGAGYVTIPVELPPTDRPAAVHGDLNLALRSYKATSAPLALVDYSGGTDPGAPRMRGMFSDNRTPAFTSAYRVYDWNWGCGADGCRGSLLTTWPVTLLGMKTRAGELLAAPTRTAEIYPGGYSVLVLYAEPTRLTLKYTRNDNVQTGYTVHLEHLDVDANLLALYQWANAAGRSQLPALKNGQPLGRASGAEVLVAIRDCGSFLDPRSRKDWW